MLLPTAWSAPLDDWLRKNVSPPTRGETEWTLVLTTGHFGRDPRLAEATRIAATEALFAIGAKSDRVRVIAAEMMPWGEPKILPLTDLSSALPTAPSPGSRGGRDIEAILAAVAPEAKGPILVLSPGASQLPVDGKGSLLGGDGSLAGFASPFRQTFDVATADGPRPILATLLTKQGAFMGTETRESLSAPRVTPPIREGRVSPEKSDGLLPWTLPIFLVGGLSGYALGRYRRGTANAVEELAADPLSKEPEPDEGLAIWRDEARKQQRKLDMIAQDLAEAAGQLSSVGDLEKIELRQELGRRDQSLKVWDETAMDYLDGIERALEHPALAPERRQTWERAAAQFGRLAQRAGLDTIAPSPGDPVLDGHHRIEAIVPASEDGPNGTVASLLAPGYRRGDVVLRQARIEMAGNSRP